MRLVSLELRGLPGEDPPDVRTYATTQRVDFDQLGPVVAIVGQNGAGKTALIEAAYAALYRKWASRDGNLADFCTGRDAYVMASFMDDDNDNWVARLSVDAERRKIEQHLLRNGRPLTTGRNVEVAEEVRRAFGSSDLVLASVLCSQDRSGDFVGLGRAGRKAVLVEALRLQHLQELSEVARARGSVLVGEVSVLRGQLERAEAKRTEAASMRTTIAEFDAYRESLEVARAEAQRHEQLVAEVRSQLSVQNERLRAASEASAAAVSAEKAAVQAFADARRAAEVAKRTAADRERRLVERGAALKARLDGIPPELPTADLEAAAEAAALVAAAAEQQHEALSAKLAQFDGETKAASASLARARVDHERAIAADGRAGRERQVLDEQARLLTAVPCTASAAWSHITRISAMAGIVADVDLAGTCPLLANAREAAQKLTEHPLAEPSALATGLVVEAKEEALAAVERELDDCRARTDAAGRAASKAAALHASAQADLNRARVASASRAEIARALEELDADALDVRDLEAAIHAKERATALEVDVREKQLHATNANFRLAAERQEVRKIEDRLALVRLQDRSLEHVQRALDENASARAKLQGRLEAVEAELEAAAKLVATIQATEDRASDWDILSGALGRNGIQALEIDAAGPGIAGLCNELLAACYGPRFSLRFETLRSNKTTEGAQEVFDIIALDGGRERPIEWVSGGERVIVSEALSLALAIWNARRNGLRWRTLFRDESSGALSHENALAYVPMLRRALTLGGFDQVVFVTHQREIAQAADSVLVVGAGGVSVGGIDG